MTIPRIEKRGILMPMSLERILMAAPRRGRVVYTPRPAKWLRKRASFLRKWEAMQREGQRQGFIEWEPEEGYVPTTDTRTSKWVDDE